MADQQEIEKGPKKYTPRPQSQHPEQGLKDPDMAGNVMPSSFSDLRNKEGERVSHLLKTNRAFNLEEQVGQSTFRLQISKHKMLVELREPNRVSRVESSGFIRNEIHYTRRAWFVVITSESQCTVGDRKPIERYLASRRISKADFDQVFPPDMNSPCKLPARK